MPKEELPRLWELPPEEHAVGVYLGLVLGGVVLAIGTVIIFVDLLALFQEQGFVFTSIVIFRILLLVISSYASMACFSAVFRMISLQRMQVKKVDKEFRDFTMYARPLVEEVIKQRIIGERITQRLDYIERKKEVVGAPVAVAGMGVATATRTSRWGEFLVLVALLGNISVAIFLYLLQYPWRFVPYSVIVLGVAWWFVIGNFFGLLHDPRSYYMPAAFILVMPTLALLLRGYMLDFQVLMMVFLLMVLYVVAMYGYFSYLTTGRIPDFLPAPERLKKPIKRRAKSKEVPSKLKKFLPSEGEKGEFED